MNVLHMDVLCNSMYTENMKTSIVTFLLALVFPAHVSALTVLLYSSVSSLLILLSAHIQADSEPLGHSSNQAAPRRAPLFLCTGRLVLPVILTFHCFCRWPPSRNASHHSPLSHRVVSFGLMMGLKYHLYALKYALLPPR